MMHEQVFVARERELSQLQTFLDRALASHGQVCFVTGEAGAGKTALVAKFARRAQEAHPDLLVALGDCNAQTGIGDPYLPFREVLGMLTGDVEARLAQGAITQENAGRLRDFLRVSGQALVEFGPDLIDIFVPGGALATRVAGRLAQRTGWLERLEELAQRKAAGSGDTGPSTNSGRGLEQSHIFEQYTDVLQALAIQQPLMLVLDDLQWADSSSVTLLFHLARRVENSRLMIVGAYRPEDVALGRLGERHPLESIAHELKRYYGDIWVDLGQAPQGEGRQFVDAFLDTEPNRLGETFREALFRHTGGHPLFTVELLRDMQERGHLIRDNEGQWVEGPALDWETLPARVEGVIEERIGRLGEDLRELLTVAAVEGEDFTAQVICRVQEVNERDLLRRLGNELDRRHHLVGERGVEQVRRQLLFLFRFRHSLFQRYVYDQLTAAERMLLHGAVGEALEGLYGERAVDIAPQLARHFLEASQDDKAVAYLIQAGDRARQSYAIAEALQHYTRALELAEAGALPDAGATAAAIRERRGQAYVAVGTMGPAREDLRWVLEWSRRAGNRHKEAETLLNLVRPLFTGWEVDEALACARQAYAIAVTLEDSRLIARSTGAIGSALCFKGDLDETHGFLQTALAAARTHGDRNLLGEILYSCLMERNWIGDFRGALTLADEALALAKETHDPHMVGEACMLSAWAWCGLGEYETALGLLRQADELAKKARVTGVPVELLNSWGWIHQEVYDLQRSLRFNREGADLARETGEVESEANALVNLGVDHLWLGHLDQAEQCFAEAWALDNELGGKRWRWKTRLLAAWGELYLARGEAARALDYAEQCLELAERTSARKNLVKGWKLKGEALASLDRLEEAAAWLDKAVEMAREIGNPPLEWKSRYALGQVLDRQGRGREAQEQYHQAAAIIEETAIGLSDPALRETFLAAGSVRAVLEAVGRLV